MVRLSLEEVEAGRTAKGGFTRAQLTAWGVAWPPPKGWLSALTKEPLAAKSVRVLVIAPDVAARCDCPEPDSPAFDSAKHGLLAPPRTTYRRTDGK